MPIAVEVVTLEEVEAEVAAIEAEQVALDAAQEVLRKRIRRLRAEFDALKGT